MVPVNSAYQIQPTHYANLALSAHAIVDDLIARADRLAPRFSYETLEAGCTNTRPSAAPRKAKVWDLHAEALSWNLIADRSDVVLAAKGLEAEGTDFYAAWSCDETDRIVLISGPTPSYHESIEIARQAPAGRIVVAQADEVAATDHTVVALAQGLPATSPGTGSPTCPAPSSTPRLPA